MNPEQYQFIKQILEKVYNIEANNQLSFIEKACQSRTELIPIIVEMLEIGQSEQAKKLDQPAIHNHITNIGLHNVKNEEILPKGTSINDYIIIEQIGSGGMGNVYSAKQSFPAERIVAIKLLKSIPNFQFFESESHILAQLNHPNIATLYEVDKTPDGQYFIVMEYIDGYDIIKWSDNHKLDLNSRIKLFQQLCSGISYAHEKGIIHCDIKPNNVLITEINGNPVVKIIDFGISRLESQNDGGNNLAGTPAYLAPEVLSNPKVVDTRRDVYSLGVLLKKLLAESQSGELKSIVNKATAFNKQERYASPVSLGFDLSRYLNKKPVRSFKYNWYQLSVLFVRRNLTVVIFSMVLLLSLIIGFIAQYQQAELAKKQSQAAQLAQKEAEEISEFLIEIFNVANPEKNTNIITTPENLIHRAKSKLLAIETPDLTDARFMHTIGNIYARMEKLDDALEVINTSLKVKQSKLPENDPSIISDKIQLGLIYRKTGKPEEAEKQLLSAVDLIKSQATENSHQLSTCYNALGNLYIADEKLSEAIKYHEMALEIRKELDDKESIAESYNNLGVINHNSKNWKLAAKYYYLSLDIYNQIHGENHPYIATLKNNLALIEQNNFNWQKSEDLFSEAWINWQYAYGENHSSTITAKRNLALFYNLRMKYDRAIEIYDLILSAYEKVNDKEKLAKYNSMKAQSYAKKEEFEKANQFHRLAIDLTSNLDLSEKYLYNKLRSQYAQTLISQNKFEEAKVLLNEALKYLEENHPKNNYMRLYTLNILADLYSHQHEYQSAIDLYNEVIGLINSNQSSYQLRRINALIGLGKIYREQTQYQKSEDLYLQALHLNQSIYGESHKTNGIIYFEIGKVKLEQNNLKGAEDYLNKALKIQEIALPQNDKDLLATQQLLDSLKRNVKKY